MGGRMGTATSGKRRAPERSRCTEAGTEAGRPAWSGLLCRCAWLQVKCLAMLSPYDLVRAAMYQVRPRCVVPAPLTAYNAPPGRGLQGRVVAVLGLF